MKIKPSARIKKRHFLIDGNKSEIEKIISKYKGKAWFAEIKNREISEIAKGKLIITIDRKIEKKVRNDIEESDKVRAIRVSGTLKGLGR
jgi:hypothetical protein